jgi:D-arabinose 1-dehydrogenase-like Zn-dependent alcohol dehydrogenase
METTMKAAVARVYGQPLIIGQVPVPTVIPGRILVKVAACGVCHTDLHAIDGDWPVRATLPLIPGHEGVGTVVAVGAGVQHVKKGDGSVRPSGGRCLAVHRLRTLYAVSSIVFWAVEVQELVSRMRAKTE